MSSLPAIHPNMQVFFGYCISRLALIYRARMDNALTPLGLIAPQCGILHLVDQMGPLTQKDFGKYLGIDKATMVRLIDDLEAEQLLKRNVSSKDRRAKALVITPKGKNYLLKIHTLAKETEKEALKSLSPQEQKILRKLVFQLTLQHVSK